MGEQTVGEEIQSLIKQTDLQVNEGQELEGRTKPPVVQELVLARRHLEDANNRFKKAYNMLPQEDK